MSKNDAIECEQQLLISVLKDIPDAAEEQMKQFAELWHEIGVKESNRESRRKQMKDHIMSLLGEMLEEEQNVKGQIENDIRLYREDLEKLSVQLKEDFTLPNASMSLLETQEHLKHQAESMRKKRTERQKRFKRLVEMECGLCKALGQESKLLPLYQAQAMPTSEEMQEYRQQVEALDKLKEGRQTDFFMAREDILRLWSSLDHEPKSDFEICIMKAADQMEFVLSEGNMEKLTTIKSQLEEMDAELTEYVASLRAGIISLWNRLEVEQVVQEAFMNSCSGPKPSIAEKFQRELERLEELKKANMQRFIETTRKELVEVWDLCLFGQHQRQHFLPFFQDVYDEDLLSAHESELDRMKGFYRDHVDLFKMITKREDLWKKMLEAEARANDPNRFFQNRGGQLLKEEKMRKKVEKDLPKVEADLCKALLLWEEDHGRVFEVDDARYIDTIDAQWRHFREEKDQQKVMRQKAKAETTALEMTYGSVPGSPTKRKVPTTTPANAQPKVRKVGPSPLIKSSKSTTKGATNLRAAAKTKPPIGGKTPKKLGKNPTPRKILTDHNVGPNLLVPSNDTFVYGQTDISLASTVSTYSEFQRGVHGGIESQTTARSSCIPRSSSTHTVEGH